MSENTPDWPRPEYNNDIEPHFIFIITPPYSGSTALCQLLNTSHRSMLLHPKGEGQWLVPGLHKARWRTDLDIDYESVRAVWLNTFQTVQASTKTVDVVIEKSPPNMIRMEALSSQFSSCSFIANNRDPYANCASILYRHHNADALDTDKRISILQKLAADWQFRSRLIRQLVEEKNIPVVTYETFCNDPTTAINALDIADDFKTSINPKAEVQVKDYQQQPVANQNERQISALTVQEIEAISSVMSEDDPLMEFFGYARRQ
jgi:hypothetical protein